MSEAGRRCGALHGSGMTRRRGLSALLGAGVASAMFSAPRDASAGASLAPALPEDDIFMKIALDEAARADFPFGAAIVRARVVIATGRNLGEKNDDPTAHAEMVALRAIVAARSTAMLRGATLYATGEPCPMCMGAILWCGIARLVFGASIAELSTKIGQINVTSRQLAEAAPFANIEITGGVMAKESLALFKG